jgi:hypothetical protein
VDPYLTPRKVFAEGMRVSETNLKSEPSEDLDTGEAKMKIPTTRLKKRVRMFRRLPFGAVPGLAPLCLDTNDPQTMAAGVQNRLLRTLPKNDAEFMQKFDEFTTREIETLPKVQPYSYEDWRLHLDFNQNRKKQLDEAYERSHAHRPTLAKSRKCKSFGKGECYNKNKHCRGINSRIDETKVYFGPRISALEDMITSKYPEFVKHDTPLIRGQKVRSLKKYGWHYYETDFTAFESHFTAEVMQCCEGKLLRHCFGEDGDYMARILEGENHLSYRCGVKVDLKARRMSGDMITSLGNGFTNLMLIKFLVFEKGGSYAALVEGDDGLIATDITLDPSDFLKLGFTIKMKEVTDPCSASFCGLIFADSGEFVRDPVRFFTEIRLDSFRYLCR